MVRVAMATCRSSRRGLLLRLRRLPRLMAAAGFRGKLSLDRGCDDPAARALPNADSPTIATDEH